MVGISNLILNVQILDFQIDLFSPSNGVSFCRRECLIKMMINLGKVILLFGVDFTWKEVVYLLISALYGRDF